MAWNSALLMPHPPPLCSQRQANGKKITSTPELITALTKNIDSGISITVIRGLEGKRVELSLKPEEQDFKGHL